MILYKQYKVAADSSGCKEMRRRQLRQLCVSALFFCCLLSNFSCFKIRHSLSRYLEVTLRCLLTQCEASSRLCFFNLFRGVTNRLASYVFLQPCMQTKSRETRIRKKIETMKPVILKLENSARRSYIYREETFASLTAVRYSSDKTTTSPTRPVFISVLLLGTSFLSVKNYGAFRMLTGVDIPQQK